MDGMSARQANGGYVWRTTQSSELLLARYVNDLVVVKRVLHKTKHEDEQRFRREMEVHKELRHPNIMHLRYWFLDEEERLHLVTDFMKEGSMMDLLNRHRTAGTDVPLLNVIRILRGIASGLSFLRFFSGRGRVMHRDLNPNNVLLTENLEPCITDFGLAKEFDVTQRHTTNLLPTLCYAAPEMFSTTSIYNEKVDIFSFGHLIYSLLTRKRPHEELKDLAVAGKLSKEANELPVVEFRPRKPEPRRYNHIDVKLIEIMLHCWKHNPNERPSADDILKDLEEIWQSRDSEPLLWTAEQRYALYFNLGMCTQPGYQHRPESWGARRTSQKL